MCELLTNLIHVKLLTLYYIFIFRITHYTDHQKNEYAQYYLSNK